MQYLKVLCDGYAAAYLELLIVIAQIVIKKAVPEKNSFIKTGMKKITIYLQEFCRLQ